MKPIPATHDLWPAGCLLIISPPLPGDVVGYVGGLDVGDGGVPPLSPHRSLPSLAIHLLIAVVVVLLSSSPMEHPASSFSQQWGMPGAESRSLSTV